jgi:hypothetical protein
MKLDEAVSTKCVIRTASGINEVGSNSWLFISTANNNPTAMAVSCQRPFIIRITGNANNAQSMPRKA